MPVSRDKEKRSGEEQRINIIRIVSYSLIVTGLLVSIYLFYRYLNISLKANSNGLDVCSAVFGKGCDTALLSNISSLIGLPLAGWGIIFYCAIILFQLLPIFLGNQFQQICNLIVYLITLTGIITALILLVIMVSDISLFCPFCTVIHFINIVLFFIMNRLNNFSTFRFFSFSLDKSGIMTFFKNLRMDQEIRFKALGLMSAFFLIISIYYGLMITKKSTSQQSSIIDSRHILKEFNSQFIHDIPISDDDASIGSINSSIRIVVFSDFLCPACRKFSNELANIIEKGNGKYYIVFKHFPLSNSCNSLVKEDIHPLACDAAFAAVAAQQQGKFWNFHEEMFKADPENFKDLFHSVALKSGLDLKLFETYRMSEAVKRKVSRDILLAEKLGVNATPTVYFNGRLVKDMRPGILQFLINQEQRNLQDSLYNIR